MKENVLIATIGASGVVAAAIIAGIFSLLKRKSESSPDKQQKSAQWAEGNTTIQIGNQNIENQNVHTGLSPSEAFDMVLAIFREYYPKLKKEALAELESLVMENFQNIKPENITPPTPKNVLPILQNANIA